MTMSDRRRESLLARSLRPSRATKLDLINPLSQRPQVLPHRLARLRNLNKIYLFLFSSFPLVHDELLLKNKPSQSQLVCLKHLWHPLLALRLVSRLLLSARGLDARQTDALQRKKMAKRGESSQQTKARDKYNLNPHQTMLIKDTAHLAISRTLRRLRGIPVAKVDTVRNHARMRASPTGVHQAFTRKPITIT